jgi:predicted 3-demethylubiquinone-9 3-methyltransferase (glyoxalase superfamily)
MPDIKPFLWFNTEAEEAADFYVSVFPNSRVIYVSRYGDHGPGPKGSVMTVEFELDGKRFVALNGGPNYKFTEAVSFVVECRDQAEIDHYWSKLTADGGREVMCGWLKDKYGLPWQIVPDKWHDWLGSGDAARSQRVMVEVMKMKKLDYATMKKAADGK